MKKMSGPTCQVYCEQIRDLLAVSEVGRLETWEDLTRFRRRVGSQPCNAHAEMDRAECCWTVSRRFCSCLVPSGSLLHISCTYHLSSLFPQRGRKISTFRRLFSPRCSQPKLRKQMPCCSVGSRTVPLRELCVAWSKMHKTYPLHIPSFSFDASCLSLDQFG